VREAIKIQTKNSTAFSNDNRFSDETKELDRIYSMMLTPKVTAVSVRCAETLAWSPALMKRVSPSVAFPARARKAMTSTAKRVIARAYTSRLGAGKNSFAPNCASISSRL
jgi:hypothetical protein